MSKPELGPILDGEAFFLAGTCTDSVPSLYRPCTDAVPILYPPIRLCTDPIPSLYRPYTDSVPTLNRFCSVSVPTPLEDFITKSPEVVYFFPKCPLVALDNQMVHRQDIDRDFTRRVLIGGNTEDGLNCTYFSTLCVSFFCFQSGSGISTKHGTNRNALGTTSKSKSPEIIRKSTRQG